MFTMDLLKGQGIPMKNRPGGAAIAAIVFAVPALVALTMLGFYLSNRIVINVTKQEIGSYEKHIEALSGVVAQQKSLEAEKDNIKSCLSEAFSSLSERTQWSPILATVIENMPDSVVLTKLETKRKVENRRVPQKDDPKKMSSVSVPVSTLQVNVSGRPHADNDKAVRDFMDRLRISDLLAPQLKDIRVSQKTDTLDGQEVVSYRIDCTFEPEI